VNIAFGQPSLLYDCDWTRIDDHPNLVTSYTIDRGRQYELDRTDTGRATVTIADQDGILDPTNPDSPHYVGGATQIEPLIQIALGRWNPVTDTWYTRYRGFVEDYDYSFDPSQLVNRLTITCVDLFEILSAIEMTPRFTGDAPAFGDDPAVVAPDSQGQIVFSNETLQDRVQGVLGDAGIPVDWFVVFTGNVMLSTTVYAPTENIMSVIQEACDGEFPAVSNAYCEGRTGKLAVHGRLARFDPAAVHAEPGVSDVWDWHHWHAGDGAAVNAGSGLAHIREFAFNRGLSKIINSAFASPAYILFEGTQLANAEGDDWARTDNADSIALYGIRSWSAENLITLYGLDGGATPGHETVDELVKFTAYYCSNYNTPKNRVTLCGFRTMSPAQPHAAATWNLLSLIEIGDQVSLTVGSPGGGGFTDEGFFVEGIHEQVNPLGEDYDDVTLTLDLSPQAYFTDLTMFGSDGG
jgi:hypothetical protein